MSPTSLLSLPFELISTIIAFLPREDALTFSLVSSGARVHTLAPLFSDFVFVKRNGDIREAYHNLKGARQAIKHSIRRITIEECLYSSDVGATNVFRLLQTLPNLDGLYLDKYRASVRLPDVALIVEVAQHTSLRNLSFTVERDAVASGLPIVGPEGLNYLCIEWLVHDEPGSIGKSLAHLYEFLRPSLATLTHLEVMDFDLFLKPTNLQHLDFRNWNICPSLHNFQYNTRSRDIKVLAVISKKFPNLTHLGIVFNSYGYNDWAVWTDECLDLLSLFPYLTHLKLCLDLELAAQDSLCRNFDLPWYRRCFLRRYAMVEKIVKVCPGLQRCEWLQLGIDDSGNDQTFPFVVSEEAGKRVVTPVMRWWMDKKEGYDCEGPLPENMIMENPFLIPTESGVIAVCR